MWWGALPYTGHFKPSCMHAVVATYMVCAKHGHVTQMQEGIKQIIPYSGKLWRALNLVKMALAKFKLVICCTTVIYMCARVNYYWWIFNSKKILQITKLKTLAKVFRYAIAESIKCSVGSRGHLGVL